MLPTVKITREVSEQIENRKSVLIIHRRVLIEKSTIIKKRRKAAAIGSAAPQANLMVLPIEIMQQILSHLNIDDVRQLRMTSKPLRTLCDSSIIRSFCVPNITELRKYEHGIRLNQCVMMLYDYFIRSGYMQEFVNSIFLSKINSLDEYEPLAYLENWTRIIQSYYTYLKFYNQKELNQRVRLIVVMTIFRMLKNFQGFSFKTVVKSAFSHQITIIIQGIWIGILHREKITLTNHFGKHVDFLLLIMNILFHDKINFAFSADHASANTVYVVGRDNVGTANYNKIKTTFVFNFITCSKLLIEHLIKCLQAPETPSKEPLDLPKDNFAVDLTVFSQKSNRTMRFKNIFLDFTFPPHSVT